MKVDKGKHDTSALFFVMKFFLRKLCMRTCLWKVMTVAALGDDVGGVVTLEAGRPSLWCQYPQPRRLFYLPVGWSWSHGPGLLAAAPCVRGPTRRR